MGNVVLENTSVSKFCIVLWICERYIFDMIAAMTWKYDEKYQKTRDSGNREKTKKMRISKFVPEVHRQISTEIQNCV